MTGWRGDSGTGSELAALHRYTGSRRPGTRPLANHRGQRHRSGGAFIRRIGHPLCGPRLCGDLLDDKRLQRRPCREGLHARQDCSLPPRLNRRRLSGREESQAVRLDHGDEGRSQKSLSAPQLAGQQLKQMRGRVMVTQVAHNHFNAGSTPAPATSLRPDVIGTTPGQANLRGRVAIATSFQSPRRSTNPPLPWGTHAVGGKPFLEVSDVSKVLLRSMQPGTSPG